MYKDIYEEVLKNKNVEVMKLELILEMQLQTKFVKELTDEHTLVLYKLFYFGQKKLTKYEEDQVNEILGQAKRNE